MSKVPHYLLLTFLCLAALFLSAEVWMQAVRHTSFCTTTACDVVGDYIRFGEGNLIKLGAFFFWMLWLLVFFAGRYPKAWIWGWASMLLFGALACDGALLGFQFIGLKEKCLLCIVVASLLFSALALFSWVRTSFLTVFLGLSIWAGGFTANAILDLGVIPPDLPDTGVVAWTAPEAQGPQHVLFFSLHCDHCSKVLANLSINTDRLTGTWILSCADNKEEDLYRLATIQTSDATSSNPFLETLRLESLDTVEPVPVSNDLRQTVRTARTFFKTKGFQGVPVMIVMEKPGKEYILRGESNITAYLREQGYLQRELNFPAIVQETNSTAQ
ncbi:hypothetical protein MASR1M90_00350 [Desulfovibrionales bacterium]